MGCLKQIHTWCVYISMCEDWFSKILLRFLDRLTTLDPLAKYMQLLAYVVDSLTRTFCLLASTETSTV